MFWMTRAGFTFLTLIAKLHHSRLDVEFSFASKSSSAAHKTDHTIKLQLKFSQLVSKLRFSYYHRSIIYFDFFQGQVKIFTWEFITLFKSKYFESEFPLNYIRAWKWLSCLIWWKYSLEKPRKSCSRLYQFGCPNLTIVMHLEFI